MAQRSFRRKAEEQGVERPFAILRSMGTGLRERMASLLGLRIPREKRGDPDAESWIIINRDLRGLQARTHSIPETFSPFARSSNWWEIVCRTARRLWIRFYPGLPDYEVERLILERTAQLTVSQLGREEISTLDDLAGRLSGFRLTVSALELSEDAIRLILVGLWRASAGAGAMTRAGAAQAAAWINERMQRYGFMPSVTRGLRFLRESMDGIFASWTEIPMRGRQRRSSLRRLALAISAIHLQDVVERRLCEYETTRT